MKKELFKFSHIDYKGFTQTTDYKGKEMENLPFGEEGLRAFLLRFLQKAIEEGHHGSPIFEILLDLAKASPSFPLLVHLKNALEFLDNVDKTFVERRSPELFTFLLEKLARTEISPSHRWPNCHIFPFLHLVSFPFQEKEVMGLLVEFEGIHPKIPSIQKLLRDYIPEILIIQNAFFCLLSHKKNTTTFYFEVQKKEGIVSQSDIEKIQKQVYEIGSEITTPSTFEFPVLGNYEISAKTFHWIMNDIQQGDMPHVFIDIHRQTYQTLRFSVLVCRVKEKVKSLEDQLNHPQIYIEWQMTKSKNSIDQEGAILKVDIPFKAPLTPLQGREQAGALLKKLIGPFRDINGGLLEKSEATFNHLKANTPAPPELLRDFFLSITPEERRTTTPIPLLKTLYLELDKQKESDLSMNYTVHKSGDWISIKAKMPHKEFEKRWREALSKRFPAALLSSLSSPTSAIVGCSLLKPSPNQAQQLQDKASDLYTSWKERKEVKQALNLCCTSPFTSFDPRTGTEEEASYLHRMLFEGLMRMSPSVSIEPAIAEKVEISKDRKYYRFFLRKSVWSNGTPLTAHDFAYSWKMTLSPSFSAPLSYLFDPIEHAKEVKEGQLPTDSLGVQVVNDYILDVRLSYPSSSFLQVCALVPFFPICHSIDVEYPSWSEGMGKDYVCNGPFILDKKGEKGAVTLKKNPRYWEKEKVELTQVSIPVVTEEESVTLFKKKKVDALLYPFCRSQDFASKEPFSMKKLEGGSQICYLYMNCSKPPFQNKKIRKALSLALNRKEIAKAFSEDATAHYSPYAPEFSHSELKETEDLSLARKLFFEALVEKSTLKDTIYTQTIYAPLSGHKHLMNTLVGQVNQAFGLNWKISVFRRRTFSKHLENRRDFQPSINGWVNRIDDPGYFLEVLSSSKNVANFSFWTNKDLQSIIDEIRETQSEKKKRALHYQAERLLIEEMPAIPLFYTPTYSLCQTHIEEIHTSIFQQFDIRYTYKR